MNLQLQDENSNKFSDIKQSLEKCVEETQADLKQFKCEQNQLRTEIENIIAENKRFNTKLEGEQHLSQTVVCSSGETKDDATRERLTADTLKNVKQQIDCLQAENEELRSLNETLQKTIQNLENELNTFRQHIVEPTIIVELKHKYATAIKLLESTIKSQNTEIIRQTRLIESICTQRKELRKHIENLENALHEKERELNECCGDNKTNNISIEQLKSQLFEATQKNRELEESVKMSKIMIEERFEREKCALQKVQEALAIAEMAVKEKEMSLRREKVIKEECDNLASTIGEVMDEAARKVENDMLTLRERFAEKEKTLLKSQEKISADLQNQTKYNQILDTRCSRFEQKCRDAIKENEHLKCELQSAKTLLEEAKLKLQANTELITQFSDAKIRSDEQETEIQKYMRTNKQLKEKYKATVDDMTKRFEKEIHRLQNENATLKAENRVMKVKKCVMSDCDDS